MDDSRETFEVSVHHSISGHSDPPSDDSDDECWNETVDSDLEDDAPQFFMPTSDLLMQSSKLKNRCPQASMNRSLSRKILVRLSKYFVSTSIYVYSV